MALYDSFFRPARSRAGLFSRLAGTFHAWNDARMTRNALARLTSHELEDIGLGHGDVDVFADGRRR